GFFKNGCDHVDRQPAAERAGGRHRAGDVAEGTGIELARGFELVISGRDTPTLQGWPSEKIGRSTSSIYLKIEI
ncbi:MAG TPA: hypothetical protein VK561_12310, partial [Bradyrhizobium sp.]|nr:hypothetical protein [Bradyrhizobium sp.]